MTTKNLLVTVEDSHKDRMDEVAANLRSQGMEVSSVLKSIRVISGTCSKQVAELKHTPGVKFIEEEQTYRAS